MIATLLANWKWVLIAALVAVIGAQELRVNHAQVALADYRLEVSDNARLAALSRAKEQEAAHLETQRRYAEKDANVKDAQAQVAKYQKDAVAADAAADGMRRQTSRLFAALRAATRDPGPAVGSAPAADPGAALDLLAGLLSGTDSLASELGKALDRSRLAGLTCERAYDSLTAKSQTLSAP